MHNKNVLAIIPARGGSKRLPRKNIRSFFGKPIISYSIAAAKSAGCFDTIMVSTEDKEIADVSKEYGAEIPFVRSNKCSNDFATLTDVIFEVIHTYESTNIFYNYICCILATAPFLSPKDLNNSFKILLDKKADTVVSVVKFTYPIQRALKINSEKLFMISPEYISTRSNDLETTYHDAAQFYWLDVEKFKIKKMLFSDNSFPYELQEVQVQDIDNEIDWTLAEMKYTYLNLK